MKLVFFGTGRFGLPTLKKLLETNHEILLVVTQPDKAIGRHLNVQPTPIKAFIEQAGPAITILQPKDLRDRTFIDFLKKKEPDIFIVIDYGVLLKKEVLDIPKKYCINLHPSLLPKYRGAAPVNWAILNSEFQTGLTVLKMTEEMDAGDIILQEKIDITEEENALELEERISRKGAELMLKALKLIDSGEEKLLKQDEKKASYAPKLKKKDGEIDWSKPAEQIICRIKAMQPWPSAFTFLDGKMLKIIKASKAQSKAKSDIPGRVYLEKGFFVVTGKGAISIELLQLEGRKIMTQDEFLRGYELKKGTVLG